MRTGVLSDEHILKHCAHYRPIPMHASERVLRGNNDHHTSTPYSSKKLKYIKQVSRPQIYDTLATQLSRISGNHSEFRDALHTAFDAALSDNDNLNVSDNDNVNDNLNDNDNVNDNVTPETPAQQVIDNVKSFTPPGHIDKVFTYDTDQKNETQKKKPVSGVSAMASLQSPEPPISPSKTKAGTVYNASSSYERFYPFEPDQVLPA